MYEHDVLLRVRFEPTFTSLGDGDVRIKIKRSGSSDFIIISEKMPCVGEECNQGQEPVISIQKAVKPESVQVILDKLDMLEVKAFPKQEMGCDGGFTELEIGGYDGKAVYRWWSTTPESWRPLEDIAWEIRKLSGIDKKLKGNSSC